METDLSPLFLSVKVAIISTTIVLLTGTLLAHSLGTKRFFGKSVLESILLLPLVLPPTVIGFGLIVLFGSNGPLGILLEKMFGIRVFFSWIGAVIASVIVSFPLLYQSAKAAFDKVEVKWQDVARTMGASEWRVFWTITIPLAWPGILAGTILAFARGLGEFGATLMIAGYIPGKTDTIPLVIYFAVEAGQMEKAAFWVLIIVSLGLTTITSLNILGQKNMMRYQKDGE